MRERGAQIVGKRTEHTRGGHVWAIGTAAKRLAIDIAETRQEYLGKGCFVLWSTMPESKSIAKVLIVRRRAAEVNRMYPPKRNTAKLLRRVVRRMFG